VQTRLFTLVGTLMKLYHGMTLLLYYIDFLKRDSDLPKSKIDEKIINKLDPMIKSLIQEYK